MRQIIERRSFLKSVAAGGVAASYGGIHGLPHAWANENDEQGLCERVRDLGPLFSRNNLNITGQDGCTSCLLPSGESLWFFGDTIEGPFESIRHYDLSNALSNTACIVPKQDYSQGISQFKFLTSPNGRRARQVINFEGEEKPSRQRLWPIHSTCVGDSIYVFYHKITMTPNQDVFETFELDGMGIAKGTVGEYQFERLKAADGTFEFWKGDQPGYGVFTEQQADGYLYLWGCFWTGIFLSRVPLDQIANLASYEYLAEAPSLAEPNKPVVWRKQPTGGAVLFDNVPNEMSVSYNPYLKRYITVHVIGRDNQLALRTAPQITGPWSDPEIFYRPIRQGADDLFTSAKEHPEMRSKDGRTLYVTFVNSAEYVPRLLQVTLSND